MANLTEIFKSEQEMTQHKDKDKLVDLFRNRSELKKEFAALRDEKFKLQDRIKEEQATTARVQQQADYLEQLLADPEWAYSVVAYFQLRRLSTHCTVKLAAFAEQLKQKREQRAHGQLLADWNEQRAERAATVQREVSVQHKQVQRLDEQLQGLRDKLAAMGSLAKLRSKRRVESEIARIVEQAEAIRSGEDKLLEDLDKIQKLDPPNPAGLDIASKRTINFMILSFAQQLYLHFSRDGLSQMAIEAAERSVGAFNYGSKQECDDIARKIDRRLDSLKSVAECADVVQQRAKLIAEHASFENDDDVVPAEHSVSTIFSINQNGVVRDRELSVLGSNVFGVAKAMSR